jgi:hypothetical protein
MRYQSVNSGPLSGGLNLRDSPDQLGTGQAYDLLNVVFTARGGVQSRPGYTDWAADANVFTNRVDSLGAYYTGSAWQVAAGNGLKLETRDAAGALVGSAVTPTASPHYFTRFAAPASSSPVLYAANGTDSVRQWDGSTWTTPSYTGTTPTGKFLAVTPWDNRLVNARRSGTSGGDNKSSVRFSDPSLPASFLSYNWIDLTPGDGEEIMGLCAFNDYVFVFKQTKFFVFYGTGINAEDGTPEFSYRTVNTGAGLAASDLLCVAEDGVYFTSTNGVYKTNGSIPVLISDVIDPLFAGAVGTFYSGQAINKTALSAARMVFHGKQVMLAVPTGASSVNDTLLIFDPRYDAWNRWSLNCSALLSIDLTETGRVLLFGLAAGSNTVEKLAVTNSAAFADEGTTIRSFIKFGYTDLGASENKTVREQQVWGSGSFRIALGKDFAGSRNASEIQFGTLADKWSDGTGSDTWGDGTGSDVWSGGESADVKLVRKSVRGLIFSIELYNGSATPAAAWSVNRIVSRLREQRVPSVQKTDR